MVDRRKEAIELAQERANERNCGHFVYLRTRRRKNGTAFELEYHVTREGLPQPRESELVAYVIPKE